MSKSWLDSMQEQSHALADPKVAPMHECPGCYFASREKIADPGMQWPVRTRLEHKVEAPCSSCGTRTIWCTIGEWRSAPRRSVSKQ